LTGVARSDRKLWSNEREQELDRAAYDGNPSPTPWLHPNLGKLKSAFDLRVDNPKASQWVESVYASLNGAVYEPLPDFQFLEFRNGQDWKKLRAQVIVNYGRAREFAVYQNSGSVVWDYQFPPIEMNGVRVVLGKTLFSSVGTEVCHPG
jgi:hypothetical protein